jgi:regulator of nucleoside diphosphate kinase
LGRFEPKTLFVTIMNHTPIYISRDDHAKLRLLVNTALYAPNTNASLRKLRDELDRAAVLDADAIPAGVVTMNSSVEYEDIRSGEIEEYTLTFPERANVEEKRLSILAPIGTALIGFREGDVVDWITPGGTRRLRIRRVRQPQETPQTDRAAGMFSARVPA